MFIQTHRKVLLTLLLLLPAVLARPQEQTISKIELHDKIAASWIGQMIGNIYGLPHENKYIDAPGKENWPYGYSKNLDKLAKYDGAFFSDDDTDVEYMYLLQMEKWGPELPMLNYGTLDVSYTRQGLVGKQSGSGLNALWLYPAFHWLKSAEPSLVSN